MTPTPHGQVPEALRLAEEISNLVCSSEAAAKTIAAAADELCRLHVENASLRAQQPASPPAEQQAQPDECFPGEPKVAVPQGLISAACFAIRNKRDGGKVLEQLRRYSVGDRSQPLAPQQAAPKAAPGMGNSGFDHQTAADFLNGKTISDEAVRNFVATSRWAHDERAALSATLLAMHGVLTSREAEIALLKKALLEAETATQQEAQEPVAFIHWPINGPPRLVWYSQKALNDAILKTHEDGYKPDVKLYTAPHPAHSGEPVAWLNPWRADQVTTDYDAYGERGIPLYTAPQPTPAPLSDDVVREPLTDEQLAEMMRDTWGCASIAPRHALEFARTVERAHGFTQKGGQHGADN